MEQQYQWFLGIDWGGSNHQVCLLNNKGENAGSLSVEHCGEGLSRLICWLRATVASELATVAAALEVPHGAIVETLAAHGVNVFTINPKQLARFRDRYSVGGAKDDRRDARVLAASLRTDIAAFRHVGISSAFSARLRELSHVREDLEREHRRLSNQLRDLLLRYFPELLLLSPAADDPWFWKLLAIASLPKQAAALKPAEIEVILRAHRIRRWTAAQVCKVLSSKSFDLIAGFAESIAEHVDILLPLLHVNYEQRKKADRLLTELVKTTSEGAEQPENATLRLLMSLPGVGVMVATTLLAEAGHILAAKNHGGLRCYAGVAPVTKQSGKSRRVVMRRGCNERVREACYHWARVSVQKDEASRIHYQELRNAGHKHGRALRGVSDRLLSVLMAMLRSGEEYNSSRSKSFHVPPKINEMGENRNQD